MTNPAAPPRASTPIETDIGTTRGHAGLAGPAAGERTRRARRGERIAWVLWPLLLALVTVALVRVRGELDQAHVVLTMLLVILGASASGGRALGLSLACVGFLLIDYYFQPPFDTITVDKGLDWIVLLAFVATAVVATQLLAQARAERELAEDRAREIDQFASLGAETLNAGRAADALLAIATVIRDAVGIARSEIVVDRDVDLGSNAPHVYAAGPPLEADRHHALEMPLSVRDVRVGMLHLLNATPIALDAAQRRSLTALSYYAALAVERARLGAVAEHATALREADQLKDALLAAVSHDLRTPLTTIKALARLGSERGDPNSRVIEAHADRLNHMVADLLDLSRINGGALRLSTEIAAAEDLVGAAIRDAHAVLGHRRIVATMPRDGPLLLARFDFGQSLRILSNLIENAKKYSPEDAAIEIRVGREDSRLLIEVADRGIGIAESERERVFEPFFRGRRAPPDVEGAGLGLAIASRLAAAQGGSLAYAPRPGGGSVFALWLPAVESPTTAAASETLSEE